MRVFQDLQMTKKEYEKHAKANFSFMASLWQPNAGPEELRTICDWNKWVESSSPQQSTSGRSNTRCHRHMLR